MIRNMQVLIIDDEPQVRRFVSVVLKAEGWEVSEAETAENAFELMRNARWDLVLCDVMLGGADGFAVLSRFIEEQPEAQVVLMTGRGSAEGALTAVSSGAYDYLLKPFSVAALLELSQRVLRRLEDRANRNGFQEESGRSPAQAVEELVGRSSSYVEVIKLVARLAPTNLPVLISGESGTGKEVVARAIHRRSRRAAEEFVAVNCGAIAAELIESELFGHVRGSFTGADRDRAGLFEEASGGTVLLDEITETSPAFQVKLLRALQQGEIRRVGSNRTVKIDVRVLAATNRDIEGEVLAGRFRQDLLYRLNAVILHLPPLRERREDILLLAQHFAVQGRAPGEPPLIFSPEAIQLFHSYPWPGNIRELENVVLRASTLCERIVRPEDLPEKIRNYNNQLQNEAVRNDSAGVTTVSGQEDKWLTLADIEERYVARVLAHTKGNKQAASRLLGVDRRTIERIMKRCDDDNNATLRTDPEEVPFSDPGLAGKSLV
jgi:two-component system response regulator AtoC